MTERQRPASAPEGRPEQRLRRAERARVHVEPEGRARRPLARLRQTRGEEDPRTAGGVDQGDALVAEAAEAEPPERRVDFAGDEARHRGGRVHHAAPTPLRLRQLRVARVRGGHHRLERVFGAHGHGPG